jgi:hypothetical protein
MKQPIPDRVFVSNPDGKGREYMPLYDKVVGVSSNLMSKVESFPVYYWSEESLIQGSVWNSGVEASEVYKRMARTITSPGAIHFFDVLQSVHNSELGVMNCVGMIRYEAQLLTMLYVSKDFNWDNLSHGIENYNIYFLREDQFSKFYFTWATMLEAYAKTPLECDTKKFLLTPARAKGIDNKTQKSYRRNPVNVVCLRKLVYDKEALREKAAYVLREVGSGNTLQVQFDVTGHYRQQWYPSEGKHRTIWIESYTKGKDKPRVIRPTVHKVVERSNIAKTTSGTV